MKKLFLSFCLVFTLAACSDPTATELQSYVNEQLLPLEDLESDAIAEYDSVSGNNYTDDLTMYNHINDVVIPLYSDFVDELEAITIEDPEIREVHEIYVAAVNKQYNAMLKILAALENGDYDMASEANQMLSDSRAEIRRFNTELTALAKEYGLEFE